MSSAPALTWEEHLAEIDRHLRDMGQELARLEKIVARRPAHYEDEAARGREIAEREDS